MKHAAALLLALTCSACGAESTDGYDPQPFEVETDAATVEQPDAGTPPVVPSDAGQKQRDAFVPDAGGLRVVTLRTAGTCTMHGASTGTALIEPRCVTPAEIAAGGCTLASEADGRGAVTRSATIKTQIESARFAIATIRSNGSTTTHLCTGTPIVGIGSLCGHLNFWACTDKTTCADTLYNAGPVPTHYVMCG